MSINVADLYTDSLIKICNKNTKKKNNLESQYVCDLISEFIYLEKLKHFEILDFHSSSKANVQKRLIELGYSATAHEVGNNFISGLHDPLALYFQYDIIVSTGLFTFNAKSVVNASPIIKTMLGSTNAGGHIFFSIGNSSLHNKLILNMFEESFEKISLIEKNSNWNSYYYLAHKKKDF